MSSIKKSAIKADLNHFYQTYYAESLEKNGFIHYGNDYFDWYKLEDGLLKQVHLTIHEWSSPFLSLEVGFGVLPLYIWDDIPQHMPYNENSYWMSGGGGGDRLFRMTIENSDYWSCVENRIGSRPRNSYCTPAIITLLPCGKHIIFLNSEQRGAEALDEVAFPMLSHLKSVSDVYAFNLELRYKTMRFRSVDDFIVFLQTDEMYKHSKLFTTAFADECIAVRDEKMYPVVIDSLKRTLDQCTFALSQADTSWLRKNRPNLLREAERSSELIKIMQDKDYTRWEEGIIREKEKMIQQIKKKLPELKGIPSE